MGREARAWLCTLNPRPGWCLVASVCVPNLGIPEPLAEAPQPGLALMGGDLGLSYQTWLHALPSQLRVAAESLGASELDSQGPSSSPPHSTPRGCICSSGTRGNPRQLAWLLEACFRVERTLGSDLSAPAALRPAPLDGCRRCQRGDVASRLRGGLGWALGQPGLHILEAWIFVWGQTWKSAPELSASRGCACSPGSTHGGPGQWWVMQ